MTVKNYAIVNGAGLITNVLLWDGTSPWTPPEGDTAVQIDNAVIGGTYIGGTYTPPVQPPPPTPTPAQAAAQALSAGINITSTGTSSLNGAYLCDSESVSDINAVVSYILVTGNFPGGGSTMPWIDTSGNAHVFPDVTHFKNFAIAVANFVAACKIYGDSNGSIGSIPSNNITIA